MNLNCMKIGRKIEKISRELEIIYGEEKQFPEGELLCRKNEKRFKWYVKNREGTIYLPKNKKELAQQLALKKYYTYKKQELESELATCNVYLRKMLSKEGKAENFWNIRSTEDCLTNTLFR